MLLEHQTALSKPCGGFFGFVSFAWIIWFREDLDLGYSVGLGIQVKAMDTLPIQSC